MASPAHREEPDASRPAPDLQRLEVARAARRASEFGDEEAIQVLKLGGAIGIFFLLGYWIYDIQRFGSGPDPMVLPHWVLISGTCVFFGLTWTPRFRRHWRMWTLLFSIWLMLAFIKVSAVTQEAEPRFIAILLCPIAAASFVDWSPRWQLAMGAASLACFAYAELYFPIPTEYEGYRWFGLLAAVSVGQATSVFVDRYRRRLRGHVAALEEAGNFRERQIAIMAHDIRSPVGAISGYASLLEDGVANDTEREQLVARMGATAWNVDLVVGNVLDLYQIEAAGPMLRRVEIDPNRIIEETVEDCAMQARRERVRLVADLATLPRGRFDPACLGRIVRNMLATAIRRARAGQVSIATRAGDGHLTLEVRDSGLPMPPHELERLFDPPSRDGGRKAPGGLAAHLVRTLTEAHGGRVEAKCEPGGGLVMIVELPLDTDAARGAR